MQQKKRFVAMMAAVGIGLSIGWVLPAQDTAPKAPNWKDRAEYDIAVDEYGKAKDDKGRLEILDKWTKAYPDSELWQARDETYMNVYVQMKDNRKLIDKAKAMRAKKPDHYLALVYLMTAIPALTPPNPAETKYAEEVGRYVKENADRIFAPANKPGPQVTDEAFAKLRPEVMEMATRTIIWSLTQQNNFAKLEPELIKAIQADPTQATYSYTLGKGYVDLKDAAKYPVAIFHLGRAAVYEGKNALDAKQRATIKNSITPIYTAYHGSTEGLDAILALAKTSAMPPADFMIVDKNTIAKAAFDKEQTWIAEHPMEAFWRDVLKAPLIGPDGAAAFANYEGALFPPDGEKFTHFKGKIISMTPAISPLEIEVAVFDPNVADAKLVFKESPGGEMPIGSELSFKGVAKSFQKEPFMVTFDMDDSEVEGPELVGWTGVAPPDAPKPSPKGKGRAKAKGGKAK